MPRIYSNKFRSFMDTVPGLPPFDCWPWPHFKNSKGYGCHGSTGTGTILVHRAVYKLLVGDVPRGLDLDHLCRNRSCCNPAHLEIVDHRTNVLRGNANAAKNAIKTHCLNGHPFTPENTKVRAGQRGRTCIACEKLRGRRHYLASKGHALKAPST